MKRRLGESQYGPGGEEKVPSLPMPGIKPQSPSPQLSPCTDRATPALNITC